jgi:hypothetical protein
VRKKYWVIHLLVLTVATLVFGDATLAKPLVADVKTLPSSQDGYSLTFRYWNELNKQANDLQNNLQNLYRQAAAAFPQDKERVIANFINKLNEQYPGSKFDGVSGSVLLPGKEKLVAHVGKDFKVEIIEEIGTLNGAMGGIRYYLQKGVIALSSNIDGISATIDVGNAATTVFKTVHIYNFKEKAEKVISSIDKEWIVPISAETAVLNDAYKLLAMTEKIRMDVFAGNVMCSEEWQDKVLAIARSGYYERHPEEFGTPQISKTSSGNGFGLVNTSMHMKTNTAWILWGILLLLACAAVLCMVLKMLDKTGIIGRLAEMYRRKFRATNDVFSLGVIDRISREGYEDIIISYFRSRGYLIERSEKKITKQIVDFKLIKDGKTTYLQCSKWKAKRIEVEDVRSFHTIMHNDSVIDGIIVSPAHFSRESRMFVDGKSITLIYGDELLHVLKIGQQVLRSAVEEKAIEEMIPGAVAQMVNDAVQKAIIAVDKAVSVAVDKKVNDAVESAIAGSIERALSVAVEPSVITAVERAVVDTLEKTVSTAVRQPVSRAMDAAISDALEQRVADAVALVVADAIDQCITGAVAQPVADAIEKAVAGAVEQPVIAAVCNAVAETMEMTVPVVSDTVEKMIHDLVKEKVSGTVESSVIAAVENVLDRTISDAVDQPVAVAVEMAIAVAVEKTVADAVSIPVHDAIEEIISRTVGRAVVVAVKKAIDRAVDAPVNDAVEKAVAKAVDEAVARHSKVAIAVTEKPEFDTAWSASVEDVMTPGSRGVATIPDLAASAVEASGNERTSGSRAMTGVQPCLNCGKEMRLAIANRSGAKVKAGERYWVCVDFPQCQTFIPDGVQEERMENQEEWQV